MSKIFFLVFFADGGMILQATAHCGRGDVQFFGDVINCDFFPIFHTIAYVLINKAIIILL